MIQELQNIDCKVRDIDSLSDLTQFSIYKALNPRFHNSPLLCGKPFEKVSGVSDELYKIFELFYSPSRILVIDDKGQHTLDGNTKYYWKPEYPFDADDTKYIQDKFSKFVDLGEEHHINVGQVLLVPVRLRNNEFAKIVGDVVPDDYDFHYPDANCRALCVPFEGRETPLNFGILSDRQESIQQFAWCASHNLLIAAGERDDFRWAVRYAFNNRIR
ncbi:MAG: hypothetical protein LBB23_00895 [Rickettsiales bacterium]|jgi:hypothetical protein|nr:hypothetical protein [Rickettsiales bacterium]